MFVVLRFLVCGNLLWLVLGNLYMFLEMNFVVYMYFGKK